MSTKINIDSKLAKDISEIAKSENISENKVLSDAIKTLKKELFFKKLEKRGAKITNKKRYDPSSNDFKSLCGIIDVPDGFDVAKAINDSRTGKYD